MAAWTTSASQRTSQPRYLRCINSINGIISETVLLTIMEEDEEEEYPLQQEQDIFQQENPPIQQEQCRLQQAEVDEQPSDSPTDSSSGSFNWADNVEEEYGPVIIATGARKTSYKTPQTLDLHVSKNTYALLLYTPSEAESAPVLEYASDSTDRSTSSIESDGPSDRNFDVLLAPTRYDFVFSDDKLKWYAACNMYPAFENRYDYLLFRMMRHTPKPNHLLREYDLWLQRRRDRKEGWKRDLKILAGKVDEIKAAVDNRFAHLPQNCGMSRDRRTKK